MKSHKNRIVPHYLCYRKKCNTIEDKKISSICEEMEDDINAGERVYGRIFFYKVLGPEHYGLEVRNDENRKRAGIEETCETTGWLYVREAIFQN